MPQFNDKQIDQITAAVLEQLQHGSPADSSVVDPSSSVLLIDEDVITGDLLEQRVKGSQQISVGQKSVLTPSARDYLRHHQIEWSRKSSSNGTEKKSVLRKAIIVQSTAAVKQAISEQNRQDKSEWGQELLSDTTEAVTSTISSICRAETEQVVVFADEAEKIVCLSNRNERIRAVVVENVESVKRIQKQLKPNVFVIRSDKKSYIEVRNLLRNLQD